jgi:hypothetical protein
MSKQKDNSTLRQKAKLRKLALDDLRGGGATPVVLESHGGRGRLFTECYEGVAAGVVFEKDPGKIEILARQRPTWSVYEGDCLAAIDAGAGGHLRFNVIDLDPYGMPFEVMAAVFHPNRPLADVVELVVNDGTRQKVGLGGAWNVKCLADIVRDFGNNLHAVYLEAAKEKTRRLVKAAGFKIAAWRGVLLRAR